MNVRVVLLPHELGLGYAALRKISKVPGIPALHLKTYQKQKSDSYGNRVGSLTQSVKLLMSESVYDHIMVTS